MHYQEHKEVTLAQRCNECKGAFKQKGERFYCCDRQKGVCRGCKKVKCKDCGKCREREIQVFKCSKKNCSRIYDIDDMFFDFQKGYYLCPKCMVKDYQYQYQQAVKFDKVPKEVRIMTGSYYSFVDLTNYFKNWCFCCANRIGEQDAFEMKKGARICTSCVSTNIDVMSNIIQCIVCEGYIHSEKEISEVMGSETQVLCVYCAQTQKQQLSKVGPKVQDIKASFLKSPKLKVKRLLSALEKSKLDSKMSNTSNNSEEEKKLLNVSKVQTMHSMDYEAMDMPLKIKFSQSKEHCEYCGSIVQKSNLFVLNKKEKSIGGSLPKLYPSGKDEVQVCYICFGQILSDKSNTDPPLVFHYNQRSQTHRNLNLSQTQNLSTTQRLFSPRNQPKK